MIKQMKTPRKNHCITCGSELRKRDVRKNFPFGKKSKGIKSGICWRCKNPEDAKKSDEIRRKVDASLNGGKNK